MKIKHALAASLMLNIILVYTIYNYSVYRNINFSADNINVFEKFRDSLSLEYYRGGERHFQMGWFADATELPENSKIMFRPVFLDENYSVLYKWLDTFLWDVENIKLKDPNPIGRWTHWGGYHAIYANIRSLADYKFDFEGGYYILFQAVIFINGKKGFEMYDVSRLFKVDDYVISPIDNVDLSMIKTISPERPDGRRGIFQR